jgi:hypothetical protein
MNQGLTATATIELSLGVHPPKGVLTDGQGRARRFSGWIELAAAIEDWRTASSQPHPDRVRDEARASHDARPSQHRRSQPIQEEELE